MILSRIQIRKLILYFAVHISGQNKKKKKRDLFPGPQHLIAPTVGQPHEGKPVHANGCEGTGVESTRVG